MTMTDANLLTPEEKVFWNFVIDNQYRFYIYNELFEYPRVQDALIPLHLCYGETDQGGLLESIVFQYHAGEAPYIEINVPISQLRTLDWSIANKI